MIRSILDFQGNIIGQLELPDNTPEEVWVEKLAQYAIDPRELGKITPKDYVQESAKTLAESISAASFKLTDVQLKQLGTILNPISIYILIGASQIVLDFLLATPEVLTILGKDAFNDLILNLRALSLRKPEATQALK